MTVGVFVSRDFSPVYRPRMEWHLLVMLSVAKHLLFSDTALTVQCHSERKEVKVFGKISCRAYLCFIVKR